MIEYLVPPLVIGVASAFSFCMGRRSAKPDAAAINDGTIEYNGGVFSVASGHDTDGRCLSNDVWGHRCLKCSTVATRAQYAPKHCECADYHAGHYHFLCPTCEFKAVMRTNS